MNWTAHYSAFPIIEDDNMKLYDKGPYSNYDAHFISHYVSDPSSPEKTKENDSDLLTNELVVFQQAAILPRYVVILSFNQIEDLNPFFPPFLETYITAQRERRRNPLRYFQLLETIRVGFIGESSKSESVKQNQTFIMALYDIGYCYKIGYGVPHNQNLAFENFRKAAECGFAAANYQVGWCYKHGIGVPKDFTLAVQFFQEAASKGNILSNYELGWQYRKGEGTAKNLKEAFRCFKIAADTGVKPGAYYQVGMFYKDGIGTEKDLQKAQEYLEKAADSGNGDAQNELVNINTIAKRQTQQQQQEETIAEQQQEETIVEQFFSFIENIKIL